MGFFDIFKKKLKFNDDIFGELGYTIFKDPLKNFYDGTIIFNLQEIGINIDADENGPTIEQKDFYIKIRDNYNSIKNDIISPYLNKELIDWLDGNLIQDFDKEFSVDGIAISRIKLQQIEWSFTFYCKKIDHYVTIDFKDLNPQCNTVDG